MKSVKANLEKLAVSLNEYKQLRYEAFQAGGGGVVEHCPLKLDNVVVSNNQDGLCIHFEKSEGAIESGITNIELPEYWEDYDKLVVSFENVGSRIGLEVSVVGARCRLVEKMCLKGREKGSIAIDLIDLPLAAGIQDLYKPFAIRIMGYFSENKNTYKVLLKDISLICEQDKEKRFCVDRFGQRVNGVWEDKVFSLDQLRDSIQKEKERLKQMDPIPCRNQYGGWTQGPSFKPSGFFYVQQDSKGTWWLVDPTGAPFWSIGTTGVRSMGNEMTPTRGRESLFEELPDPNGPYASVYDEGNLRLYRWNLIRKWGNIEYWNQHVLERFIKWGFNTIGNWSDDFFLLQRQIPYVVSFSTKGAPVSKNSKGFPDVFNIKWRRNVDDIIEQKTAAHKSSPWLIGYFVDNELGWRNMSLLDIEPYCDLRRAWENFVRSKYPTLEALNSSWGREYRDWKEIREMTPEDLPDGEDANKTMQEFEAIYAEKYFTSIKESLKKYDPNHLYLGCRFVRIPPHEGIIKAAGKSCDVVSVNCYSLYPDRKEFDYWYKKSGRPILIGEHHLPLASERQLLPLYPAFTESERRRFYVRYVEEFAKMPFSLGCHWFQFVDQPIAGRSIDGENQIIGFVDIADQPHWELVDAAREAAMKSYNWHYGINPLSKCAQK